MGAIEEIKQKIDIAEVIGQYTSLKKAGRNLTALCPFHSEKHPSFFVYPEQQSWHCFGACNTGGDVFAFIMKKEGLDFGEALRLLASRAGVVLPSRERQDERKEEKEALYKVNEAAAIYFNNLLLNHPGAEKARKYVEKRGFTPKTVADFQLGYSLDSWEALKQYLNEKGFTETDTLTAGLLVKSEDGRTHDRFRGKLMVPIRDIRGRVTGFGARVLDDSLPKYINSPQTPLFDKSGTLYAIDRAAPEIRKRDVAIIMEGYMDVITAHQHGVTNTVASMGTAITETQANILKKLSHNLILALDADAAGEEAMLRTVSYENILDAEMRVIVLPEGKDPDDVIREDIGAWQGLVERAMPLVDFMFEKTSAGLDLSTARDKSLAVDRLLPVWRQINNPIRQAHYLQKLAGLVKVDMSVIRAALGRLKPAAAKAGTPGGNAAPSKRPRPWPQLLAKNTCWLCSYKTPASTGGWSRFPRSISPAARTGRYSTPGGPRVTLCQSGRYSTRLSASISTPWPARRLPAPENIEKRCLDCTLEIRKRYLKDLAARKGASGETAADTSRLEEDMALSSQLRELYARRSRKNAPRASGEYKELVMAKEKDRKDGLDEAEHLDAISEPEAAEDEEARLSPARPSPARLVEEEEEEIEGDEIWAKEKDFGADKEDVSLDLDVELPAEELAEQDVTDDPVRIYLHEIGRVHLLTAGDEKTLAKHMEEGKYISRMRQEYTQKHGRPPTATDIIMAMLAGPGRLAELVKHAPAAVRPDGDGEVPQAYLRRQDPGDHR